MRSAVPQKFRLGNAARKSVMKALMSSRPLARLMQRVYQQHVRRRNLVDHTQIAGRAPKIGEPTADNSLVVILQAHGSASRLLCLTGYRMDLMTFACVACSGRPRTPVLTPVSNSKPPAPSPPSSAKRPWSLPPHNRI